MKGADSNLIAILLWKQTSFRDDKYLACRCSTLNEIQGTRAVTSCEECEDSLKAHKKGKQESDRVGFTVARKLPLKYKALSREKREQASCKVCSQHLSWVRICTIFYPDLSQAMLETQHAGTQHLAPSSREPAPLLGSVASGPPLARLNEWSPQDRAMARCHQGVAGEAVP